MGEKGVGKLSRETPPPREGEPMGANGAVQQEGDAEAVQQASSTWPSTWSPPR